MGIRRRSDVAAEAAGLGDALDADAQRLERTPHAPIQNEHRSCKEQRAEDDDERDHAINMPLDEWLGTA